MLILKYTLQLIIYILAVLNAVAANCEPQTLSPKISGALRRLEKVLTTIQQKNKSDCCCKDQNEIPKEVKDQTNNIKENKRTDLKTSQDATPSCKELQCPNITCTLKDIKLAVISRKVAHTFSADIKEACGKKYTLGLSVRNYLDAGFSCCSDKMTLVNVETQQEMDCLIRTYKDELTNGLQLWSSGYAQKECPGQWAWCGGSENQVITSRVANVSVGSCLALRAMVEGKAKIKVNFTTVAVACETRLRYLCESQEITATSSNTIIVKPMSGKLLHLQAMTMEKSMLRTIEGHDYHIVMEPKVSWLEAVTSCTQLGMRLVSLQTKDKDGAIRRFLKANVPILTATWTSGVLVSGSWIWSSHGQLIAFSSWTVGWEAGRPGDCLSLDPNTGWIKTSCTLLASYMCE